MSVTGTLDVRPEVAEIGPLLWRWAGLRSRLVETERYLLAETLRDVADALERGRLPPTALIDRAVKPV